MLVRHQVLEEILVYDTIVVLLGIEHPHDRIDLRQQTLDLVPVSTGDRVDVGHVEQAHGERQLVAESIGDAERVQQPRQAGLGLLRQPGQGRLGRGP